MHSSIDLRPEQLRLVQSLLHTHVPDREVRAFGSRVTGKAMAMSDLDLCIMGEKPLAPGLQDRLATAFSESTLPFEVDVVAWETIRDRFRAAINQATVIVQAATLPKNPSPKTGVSVIRPVRSFDECSGRRPYRDTRTSVGASPCKSARHAQSRRQNPGPQPHQAIT